MHVLEEHTMFKLAADNKNKPIILFHTLDNNQKGGHSSLLIPNLQEENKTESDIGLTAICAATMTHL